MQIGQVPIMFVPETPVNDVQSRTAEPETGDVITPSRPGEAAPVVVEIDEGLPWGTFAAIGGLLFFAWLMARPGR